ncbi:MAG: ParB N-terminal domain-containing protein [Spirochaetaceae bacterium]|jgi:ParB family chromosome partitioning protein|nr:ParB N-terminal domain-containing protein [Spirochaetaceae bacterium]
MQVPISDIKVKKRLRKDMGDIDALADSMKRFGQICPIVLTNNNILISGGRRLEAARALGWRTINAVITNIPEEIDKLEYEIEENLQRQDFSSEEVSDAMRKLHKIKNPGFFRRILNWIIRVFKRLFKAGS